MEQELEELENCDIESQAAIQDEDQEIEPSVDTK